MQHDDVSYTSGVTSERKEPRITAFVLWEGGTE